MRRLLFPALALTLLSTVATAEERSYPFLPSGTLLVSSIDGAGGLFVLRESVAAAVPPGGPRAPVVTVPPRSRSTRRVSLSR